MTAPIVIRERCIPPKTTHHAKRIVRRGSFTGLADSPALVEAKDFWTALLLPHRPEEPLEGPIRLCIELTWPFLKSDPKRLKMGPAHYHKVRPDCSNMAKTIEDTLVRLGFLYDDAQVASLRVDKYRGPFPGVIITLSPAIP